MTDYEDGFFGGYYPQRNPLAGPPSDEFAGFEQAAREAEIRERRDPTGDWPIIANMFDPKLSAAHRRDYRTRHDRFTDAFGVPPSLPWGEFNKQAGLNFAREAVPGLGAGLDAHEAYSEGRPWRTGLKGAQAVAEVALGPLLGRYARSLPGWTSDPAAAAFATLPASYGIAAARKPSGGGGASHETYKPYVDPRVEFTVADPVPATPAAKYSLTDTQRAKMEALGYDPDLRLYRGGTRQFAGVDDPRGYYDFKYFADQPDVANIYAKVSAGGSKAGDSRVTPVVAKKDNAIAFDFGGQDWLARLYPSERAVKALGLKSDKSYGMEDLAKIARAKGYDMAAFKNMIDMGGLQMQYLPLKPNAVRSPWAKFDPAHAESGDIMAGLAGTAGSLAAYDAWWRNALAAERNGDSQ